MYHFRSLLQDFKHFFYTNKQKSQTLIRYQERTVSENFTSNIICDRCFSYTYCCGLLGTGFLCIHRYFYLAEQLYASKRIQILKVSEENAIFSCPICLAISHNPFAVRMIYMNGKMAKIFHLLKGTCAVMVIGKIARTGEFLVGNVRASFDFRGDEISNAVIL